MRDDQTRKNMIIVMPTFIRNFSESMIDDTFHVFLESILAEWYEITLHGIFVHN